MSALGPQQAATSVVTLAWERQHRWSEAADRLKHDLERKRLVALALGVLGAVLAAVSVGAGLDSLGGTVLTFSSAASVGAAGALRAQSGTRSVQEWTRARSVAEAIKSEVYAHLVRGGSEGELDRRVTELEEDAADLLGHTDATGTPPGPLPDVHDLESYIRNRVQEQADHYYRPRARALERRVALMRQVLLALGVGGSMLAAAAGTWELDVVAAWVPVTTTVAAAVTAFAAAGRYDYLIVEYLRTAAELDRLARRHGSAAALSPREFVAEAERTISIQNEGWMARLATGNDS